MTAPRPSVAATLLPGFRWGSATAERRLTALGSRFDDVLSPELAAGVAKILRRLRAGGDRALVELVRRFDGASDVASIDDLRLVPAVRAEAGVASAERSNRAGGGNPRLAWRSSSAGGRERRGEHGGDPSPVGAVKRLDPAGGPNGDELPPGFVEALEVAIANVERYHRLQVREGYVLKGEGMELSELVVPLARVGVYVPGGRASYPSTVVMTVVPAQLAGVGEIVVTTPARAYRGSAALRYTLARLGVREVWGIGGAAAIGALAYGTESIAPVDKIVGPGNAWVTEAKRQVAGRVTIDGLAGPSEVVIVADADADPEWIAADLLAQAEHDPKATAILITTAPQLVRSVRQALVRQLGALAESHPTAAQTARASLVGAACVFVVERLEQALDLVDWLAPEHLQLVGSGPEMLADVVRNAGAVFVGALTPEVFGDYVAGPSHVLPTGGTARFASALGVEDFLRRSHVIKIGRDAASRLAPHAAALADAEGLPAHAAAARCRIVR